MSRTRSVGCYGGSTPKLPDPRREMWVYDGALAILLADLVRSVEGVGPDSTPAPAWWAGCEHTLRVHATVSDLFVDLHLGLDAAQREEFAGMLDAAADRLGARGPVTAEEAATWRLLGERTVIFRGTLPEETGPIVELGHALAAMLRGTLPAPPAGTLWFYGAPGGRRRLASLTADPGQHDSG